SGAEIMAKLEAMEMFPEGMFFPDTYVFVKGSSDIAVLTRAHRVMKRQLESAWSKRAPDLPMTDPYEALILASIVEKETGRASDREMIAAVFVNRLRRRMKLQTDPSVIYGMGERFDGNLRKKDLVTDTPFNTYTRRGLPPHPIAMPGLASLAAVMHPAETDALYFVSRGDGTSQFSRTLVEHNRAVAKYQMPGARRRAGR
ncbi:MAG TPA: endolytic transglycosylase MltG, partial [Burkholderiales bacterium]|nr:endolytic transglycosylase MltG [Burkholderiales bacterium]